MKKTATLLLLSFLFFFIKAQIPNAGFENWSTDINGDFNPDFWQTSNSTPDTSVFRYTPAYAGNYSILVKAFTSGGFTIPGLAYTDFPFMLRPTHFNFYYKGTIMA